MQSKPQAVLEYLSTHFLTLAQLSQKTGVFQEEILLWIDRKWLPRHSYEVSSYLCVSSGVFGETPLPHTTLCFYAKGLLPLIERIKTLAPKLSQSSLAVMIQESFQTAYQKAFVALEAHWYGFLEYFPFDGHPPGTSFSLYLQAIYQDWLQGHCGICVTHCERAEDIARKDIFQNHLKILTHDGKKEHFSSAEKQQIYFAVQQYRSVAMPFGPHDYPLSSRKKLVDDVMTRLNKTSAHSDWMLQRQQKLELV